MGPFDRLIEILTPNACILTDEDKLANATGDKRLGLLENRCSRARMITSSNIGNGAKAAETVATIGNLKVSNGSFHRTLNGRKHSRTRANRSGQLIDNRNDAILLIGANKCRYLGKLVGKIASVT